MRFLKILIMLLFFEEYRCTDINAINATHCEYSKTRPIPGKMVAEKITSKVGTKLVTKTLMKPAMETIKRVECCPGYKTGPRKSCTPKCDQFCENAICTAPNKCSCKAGFREFSPNRCIPYCESCDRGRCVGPNICECYHGYHKDESDQCVPTCKESCVNGWCSEPDVCSCYTGYELDKIFPYKCNPNCTSPCIQGRCTAPDVCDCHPGYEFKNGSKNECLPICDFCESGKCTGPSKCTCWDNYEEQEIEQGTNIVKICQPKCEDDCINGICIEVDTCACKTGYEFVKDSYNVCEPICDPPCQNGNCVTPNICLCDTGYEKIEDQCQARCDNDCINGFCAYPNQCECMDDYELNNSTNMCEAVCENCDGNCVEPNLCECSEGFEMNNYNVCVKICLPECAFGECINGTCICNDGLPLVNGACKDNETSEWVDDPRTIVNVQCSPLCENEQCVGYNNCVPICGINKEGCTNGTCIPDSSLVYGECKCFDDFELHPSSPFVCIPVTTTDTKSSPVKAIIANYFSLLLALLIVGLAAITLIIVLLNRRSCRVNYNVDEKERKVGVDGEDYVHYIINKDDKAFA